MNYNNPNDFQQEMAKFKRDLQAKGPLVVYGFLGLVLLIGALSSFYTVEPDEEAVVLRFGKYTGVPKPPCLHFKSTFGIDKVI